MSVKETVSFDWIEPSRTPEEIAESAASARRWAEEFSERWRARFGPQMRWLTTQQIFDESVEYLFRQRKPAVHRGFCRYRTASGNRCVLGYWINNEDYVPLWDNRRFFGCTTLHVILSTDEGAALCASLGRRGLDVTQSSIVELLSELQLVHDGARRLSFCEYKDGPVLTFDNRHDYLNAHLALVARLLSLHFEPRERALARSRCCS